MAAMKGAATTFTLVIGLVVSACSPVVVASPEASATPRQAPPSLVPTAQPSVTPEPTVTAQPTVTSELHCPGTKARRPGPAASGLANNWAGYVVERKRTSITCVEGLWVHPAVTCPARGTAYVAVWIGIDGVKDVDPNAALVQTGTQVACDGTASSWAWYQVLPKDPFSVSIPSLSVTPGDRISARIGYAKGSFTLELVNMTTGTSFAITRDLASAARLTAEWIVEAPTIGCPSDCHLAPLAPFGRIRFEGAYAEAAGRLGAIDANLWLHVGLDMTRGGTTRATVSGLSSSGTSFSVTFRHR